MDRVWRGVLPADSKLFLEPLHRFWSLKGPDHSHKCRDGLAVPHPLDQVQELTCNGGDATATSEEDYLIKRCHLPVHATIWSIDECPIGLVRTLLEGGVVNFPRKAAKRPEDESHVAVLFIIL